MFGLNKSLILSRFTFTRSLEGDFLTHCKKINSRALVRLHQPFEFISDTCPFHSFYKTNCFCSLKVDFILIGQFLEALTLFQRSFTCTTGCLSRQFFQLAAPYKQVWSAGRRGFCVPHVICSLWCHPDPKVEKKKCFCTYTDLCQVAPLFSRHFRMADKIILVL